MRTVELRLQDYPVVLVYGQPVALRLKRGLALLVLLAETGNKLARSRAAGLLWPDGSPALVRARLRRLVHEVNQTLGLDLVIGDGDALWFDQAVAVTSDTAVVRRAAQQVLAPGAAAVNPALQEILLAPGAHQVLEGFDLGADTFEAWLDQHRGEQHRWVVRALQRLATMLLDQAQPEPATVAAQRLIVVDPLADAGHALLLRAHAERGDLAALEAAYAEFAALLRAELGVRPSPAFEAVYAQAMQRVVRAGLNADGAASEAVPIRFADSGDGTVAYLELGSGARTLMILFGLWSHVEVAWEQPAIRAILLRLARQHRVVLLDRRGVGLSERLVPGQTVPGGVEDLEAVRRAVGADRVWLFGNAVGGMVAIEYAARHPDAVAGLVLYAAQARGAWAPDYPWAPTRAQLERWVERLRSSWGEASSLSEFAPSQAADPVAREWWARLMRQALSRNSLPLILKAYGRMDVRQRLPELRVPTLVIQREGDRITRTGAAHHLAEHIAGATLRLLPGEDHNLWAGDTGAVIDVVERFIEGGAQA